MYKVKTLILITGYARSGKDFTASLLIDELNKLRYTTARMSYAEPMKDIISTMFGISLSQLDYNKNSKTLQIHSIDNSNIVHRTTYRKLIARFGNESAKPIFGKYVWSDMLLTRARESDADVIVVPDLRFREEELYRAFDRTFTHDMNIVVVKVEREGQVNTSQHISELDMDEFVDYDAIIKNDGKNKEELIEQIDLLIEECL